MNSFYQKAKWIQWSVTIILLLIMVLVMILFTKLILINFLWYFSLILFAPIIQFCIAPLMKLIGTYEYLSPMMLVFSPKKEHYDLHSGTGFDYLFVMRNVPAGKATESKLLQYFCEGFLEIIRRIENGELPEGIKVTGTSYFMSERSAQRLGFKIGKKNWFLISNLYLNIIDLFWMYSRSKGKLSIPALNQAKSIETTGKDLLPRKEYIEKLHEHLGRQ